MIAEGRGSVAPKPIDIDVPDSVLWMLKKRAMEQAIYRDYRRGRDAWQRGLSSSFVTKNSQVLRSDEAGPFVGLVGEWGVCEFINRRFERTLAVMDLENRPLGDGGNDVEVFGLFAQIKTRTWSSPGVSLIKRTLASGSQVALSAPFFVFCRYLRESQNVITLLGCQWRKDMLDYPLSHAWKGDHFNIEIPDHDLLPMSRLIFELRQREGAKAWH